MTYKSRNRITLRKNTCGIYESLQSDDLFKLLCLNKGLDTLVLQILVYNYKSLLNPYLASIYRRDVFI